jgi:hypothetical protein
MTVGWETATHLGASAAACISGDDLWLWLVVVWHALPEKVIVLAAGGFQWAAHRGIGCSQHTVVTRAVTTAAPRWYLRTASHTMVGMQQQQRCVACTAKLEACMNMTGRLQRPQVLHSASTTSFRCAEECAHLHMHGGLI